MEIVTEHIIIPTQQITFFDSFFAHLQGSSRVILRYYLIDVRALGEHLMRYYYVIAYTSAESICAEA